VNTQLQEWAGREGVKRQAAVSSFGFSGTNAHLVLREADEEVGRAADSKSGYLVVLSAQTKEALERKVAELAEWLEHRETELLLRDIAYTLQVGRSQFSERLALVAGTVPELVVKLKALARGELATEVHRISQQGSNNLGEQRGGQLLRDASRRVQPEKDYQAALEELAQLFVNECELPWSELYETEDHRRVSLPTYPFAREYFWVPKPSVVSHDGELAQIAKLHPLLDRNTSDFEEQKFTTRLTGDEFFLSDHLINNQRVLPGVSYLELARAAGELSGGRKVVSLKNVTWLKPFTMDQESREISISLQPGTNTVTYDVWATGEQEQRVTYAKGELSYERDNFKFARHIVNIASIRERCERFMTGKACYDVLRSLGFDYGPSFQVIQELACNEREVLARLELSPLRIHELKEFGLHPSLLDGALQSGLWLMDPETVAETRFLPFALGEVRIIDNLSSSCFVHVTESTNRQTNLRKFNVRLLDDSGNLLVEIVDYSARAQRPLEARQVEPAVIVAELENPKHISFGVSDDELVYLFQQVELGELEVSEAHRLIQKLGLDFPFEPSPVGLEVFAAGLGVGSASQLNIGAD
jgi:acyl transferase domain-containing protein